MAAVSTEAITMPEAMRRSFDSTPNSKNLVRQFMSYLATNLHNGQDMTGSYWMILGKMNMMCTSTMVHRW